MLRKLTANRLFTLKKIMFPNTKKTKRKNASSVTTLQVGLELFSLLAYMSRTVGDLKLTPQPRDYLNLRIEVSRATIAPLEQI
jgi:hypothetical protein